jgi:outer membrane immunogenic protein
MSKTTAGIVVAVCAFCGTIYGGSQVSYSEAAPVPAPVTWTGFHLGAFGSYTHDQLEPELSLAGTFNQIPPPIKTGLESRGSKDFDSDGGELGGLIGFDYQLGNWVIGLESAGGYLWSRGSTDTGAFVVGVGVPPIDIRTSFKRHYLFTVAPRIGYAWGRLLPYVTGGLAVGDLEWSQTVRDLADPAAHLGSSTSETKAGWMVGGGLQYALTNHWSARVQYQFVDLGSAGFDSQVSNSPQFRSHHSADLTEHNGSFALVYKF